MGRADGLGVGDEGLATSLERVQQPPLRETKAARAHDVHERQAEVAVEPPGALSSEALTCPNPKSRVTEDALRKWERWGERGGNGGEWVRMGGK